MTPRPKIVRRIDHILIASSDAKALFSLLTDTFQLPVAWPIWDYGHFASGGVALGNVNLEVILAPESAGSEARPRFVGFALEPEPLRTTLPELQARGIAYDAPTPFKSTESDGSNTLWTTVGLPDVSSDTLEVFFCEYKHDLLARRRDLLEKLRLRDGGPLSVLSVEEIAYGATDAKRMQENWRKLLSPVEATSRGLWRVGSGPAIRVLQADKDGVLGLVINVKSLQQARDFLRGQGLLGTELPTALSVSGSQVQGLNVTLVE